MKKNNAMRIATLLLALVIITTCFVGSTLAKYASKVTADDTVTVAKWEIEVNDTEISVANPQITFDLFNTIKDSDPAENETDVKAGMIAPGTSGSFALKVENLSDVNATYAITLTAEESNTAVNVPIEYAVVADDESVDTATWTSDPTDIAATNIAMTDGTATHTVHWRWVFGDTEAGITQDTTVGIAAQTAMTVKVTAEIVVAQVD